jgi:hypothetical protein
MDFAMFEKIANNSCSEEGVAARFYDRVVKTGEVGENGLPKFKLVCFCEIRIKDNISEVYDQPAGEDKIRRFPAEYARYQLEKKQVVDGTPLEQFAFLNRAEVETLKVHGIFTVEALAAVEDDKAIQLGLAEEKQLAEKFLQQAKDNLSLKRWQKKEEEYLAKIRCLEEEIAALKKGKAAGSGKMKKEREKK